MQKVLFIAPWLADFGHGIFITIIVLSLFDTEPQGVYFLLAIVFSVIPDLDGVWEYFTYGKVEASQGAGDHRDGLHYPLVWGLAGLVYIVFFDVCIGTLCTAAVMAHFLNDSWGTGWGVRWLWPFSHKSYKFFSESNRDATVTAQSMVVSWDQKEKEDMVARLGNPNWLQDVYGHLNVISVVEYSTFACALIVLWWYLS